jgi:REP element-mobilizing transposase RayT
MVHGYHVILTAYGFWLPNDPRGSWSEFVRKWELLRFGDSTKGRGIRTLADLTPGEIRRRDAARKSLKFPAVHFSDTQIQGIARGFASACAKYGYTIWACSILPEHTHLVIARHRYKIEHVAKKLKAAASGRLVSEGTHPLAQHVRAGTRPPRMWVEGEWKSFLDSEPAIEDAIAYVVANPDKEGRPAQSWDFVIPFMDGSPTTIDRSFSRRLAASRRWLPITHHSPSTQPQPP